MPGSFQARCSSSLLNNKPSFEALEVIPIILKGRVATPSDFRRPDLSQLMVTPVSLEEI